MNTLYDKNFLNSFFTTDEFDFIQYLNDDNQLFLQLLKKQQMYRDLVVKFINIFNNNPTSEEEKNLLDQAQHIFEIINNNISILQSNNEISDNINQKIMNLLIKIESDGDNISESKYIDEINSIKVDISDYINKSEEIKNTIISNNNTIYTFLNNTSVQKYLKDFSIITDEPQKKDIEKENSLSTSDDKNEDLEITENNFCLVISETSRKVYLPYTKSEVLEYLEQDPDHYKSFEDVVRQEFIYPIDFYLKHSVVSRFRETYSLFRDREALSILESFKKAVEMMFHYDLNPAIIAACKSQEQLENYLECLKSQNLGNFKDFEIRFEISPLKV